MNKIGKCSLCGKTKKVKYKAKICSACYARLHRASSPKPAPERECVQCHKMKPHAGHGLCHSCYQQWHYRQPGNKETYYERREQEPASSREIECGDCHEMKLHYGLGLCETCYGRRRMSDPERKTKHAEQEQRRRDELGDAYQQRDREYRRNQTEEQKLRRRRAAHEYYLAHKQEMKEYQDEYRRTHPEECRTYCERHRAKKRALPADLTHEQWQTILVEHDFSCHYCGRKDRALQQDHVIPVTRGGPTTQANIVPACPNCNNAKKAKTAEEYEKWLREMGEK